VTLSPMALEVFAASVSLLVDGLVVLRSMMRLSQEFRRRTSLGSIKIWQSCNFLPWPLNVAVISKAHFGLFWSESNHR
jgi:hypothetical protein